MNKDIYIGETSIQIGNSGYINQPKEIIDYIKSQQQEIDRLNNIIKQKDNIMDELKRYLEENIEYSSDDEYGLKLTDKGDYYTRVLDKLKELKEGK